jgi:hypothetical protein
MAVQRRDCVFGITTSREVEDARIVLYGMPKSVVARTSDAKSI